MVKKTIMFFVLAVFVVLAIPEIAYQAETPEDDKAKVDFINERYIEAMGGKEAIEKLQTRFVRGKTITDLKSREHFIYEEHYYEAYTKAPDLYYAHEYSDAGGLECGYDGKTGWSKDRCGLKKDDYHAHSKIGWILNPQNALKIKDYFPELTYEGNTTSNGFQVHKLKPANRDEAYYSLYFDIDSGLLVAIGYHNHFTDYREVEGVLFPHRIIMGRKGGSTTYYFDEVICNEPIDDYMFEIRQ
jgi:hypothetical protein